MLNKVLALLSSSLSDICMQLWVEAQAALSSAGQCPVSLDCLCAAALHSYPSQLRCCRGTVQAMSAAVPQCCSQALPDAVVQASMNAAGQSAGCGCRPFHFPAPLVLPDQRHTGFCKHDFAVLQAAVQAEWALPPVDAQWLHSTMLA